MEQKNTPPPPSQVSEEEFERVFEIVDEKDKTHDMQKYALSKWKDRQAKIKQQKQNKA